MLGGPSGFRFDQLHSERICEPTRDLVLQGEEITRVAIEPLGPEMRVCRGIDQLGADADPGCPTA